LPIALVSGANRGIGRETARQLADRDYEVIVSARDEDKARRGRRGRRRPPAPARRVRSGLDRACGRVRRGGPRNPRRAGQQRRIGSDFGVSGADPDFDALQRALDTNFFGAYRLTVALLPLLRRSEHARVVNVSSGMGGITEMGGWSPGYRVSKAALNAMTRILSTELEDDGIKVNSACPGFVATDMGSQFGATKPVEDAAAGVVWLATLPDDGPSGGFFRDGRPIAF
jgi:NAD(P)-dependent dehydrogenase (short-subunit alcohol dehydrogenase family)